MYLVQLLLPLYNNSGMRFEQELYSEVRNELMGRFGGITAYTRAPVHGLWHDSEQIVRDDLIIYEIMVQELDKSGGANIAAPSRIVSSKILSL